MMQPPSSNGNSLYLPQSRGNGFAQAPSRVTVEEIMEKVKRGKERMDSLHKRMEEDFSTYRLEWSDARWNDLTARMPIGQSKVVSNEPRSFADRVIAILVAMKMNARVPFGANVAQSREFGQAKEQLFIGALRKNDHRLARLGMPSLRQMLAFQDVVRGWITGRMVLFKRPDGQTDVDISPFDPMHTYYEYDQDGLLWVAHVTMHHRRRIEQEYDVSVPYTTISTPGVESGEEVIDYYDREINAVVSNGAWLKMPEQHTTFADGQRMVPCFINPVGSAPLITRYSGSVTGDELAMFGESVFAGLTSHYDYLNQILSDRATLVRRSTRAGLVYKSVGGRKVIEGDPQAEGGNTSIDIMESLTPLELQSMAKDTDALIAHLMGEIQRKSFSHISYGGVDFPLSGYAINTLSQGEGLRLQDRITGMGSSYDQIAYLLCAQYASGAFGPMRAMGQARKGYFISTIDPQMVALADDMIIKFSPKLPKDEPAAYTMAEIASRRGPDGEPMRAMRMIREEILEIEDVDAEEEIILEERGNRLAPAIQLMDLVQVFSKRGERDKADFYMQELQGILMIPPGAPGGAPAEPDGEQRPSGISGAQGQILRIPPALRRPEAKIDTGMRPPTG